MGASLKKRGPPALLFRTFGSAELDRISVGILGCSLRSWCLSFETVQCEQGLHLSCFQRLAEDYRDTLSGLCKAGV